MFNSDVFASEEKLSLTKVAEKLEQANTACFTVCFNTKIDEKDVVMKLSEASEDDFKHNSKKLAGELLNGEERILVGRLAGGERKLGRSLVIDLPTQGFR
jgi:hypothetical protein